MSDLFLRLAEEPRLLLPRWSAEIWNETRRTWVEKLDWPAEKADSRIKAATEFFPDAMVTGYEPIVESCQNHHKDRHVLAAAVHSKTETIVTFNIKDFDPQVLAPWGVNAETPGNYLKTLFDHDQAAVTAALHSMATAATRSLPEMLARLSWYAMPFTEYVGAALRIEVPDITPSAWRKG